MKVGIISMQRVCNSGSFLQAYGLKKLIESLGHDVVFVDYHVEKPIMHSYKEIAKYVILTIRNWAIHFFINFKLLRFVLPKEFKNIVKKREEYSHKTLPILGISNTKHYNTKVDVLVIGSDEVFNCTQINPEIGFSPELFGYNAKANKIISYAASFGNTTYQKLVDSQKTLELSQYFNQFSAISVRDKNSFEIITKLTQQKTEINLDPVLMYNIMPTIQDIEKRRDFIIVYAYRERITPAEASIIKTFAQAERKKLISVSGEISWCDEHFHGSPFEVLDLFRHADYVITDTFHGTIFSIINRVKFITLIRNSMGGIYGNQEKLQDLLIRLGIQERSWSTDKGDLQVCIQEDIDYESVFNIINRERQHTLTYLEKHLN